MKLIIEVDNSSFAAMMEKDEPGAKYQLIQNDPDGFEEYRIDITMMRGE